jgi:uronate dehydrogenase
VAYGSSANKRGWWDMSSAERLGYRPAYDAEQWASEIKPPAADVMESGEGPQGGSYARR